jgi:hypothetical protein
MGTYALPSPASVTSPKPLLASAFDVDNTVTVLPDADFELLLTSIDLVVLSQAFSRVGLERALRISSEQAARMTGILKWLGVISTEEDDGRCEVLVAMDDLSLVRVRLQERRSAAPRAA